MFTPSMFTFLLITLLAIIGIVASLQKEPNSEWILIGSNVFFIIYGMYMAYIGKEDSSL